MELFRSDLFFVPQSYFFSLRLFNLFYNRMLTYLAFFRINDLFFQKPIGLFFGGIGILYSSLGEAVAKQLVNTLIT